MTLQEQMKKDLMAAMKAKEEAKKSALRVIMGELGRLETKSLSDDDVVKVLKKLMKSEKETLEKRGDGDTNDFIQLIEGYLPQQASEAEIQTWIEENIDFSQFGNRMQAMKPEVV